MAKKFLVKFTQVSRHTVGALVEADHIREAMAKAKAGDNVEEFNLTEPESWELIGFSAEPVKDPEAELWVKEQRQKENDA